MMPSSLLEVNDAVEEQGLSAPLASANALLPMFSLFGRNITCVVDQYKHVETGIQLRNCSSKVYGDVRARVLKRWEAICE
jgi:hypothetical protein